MTEGASIASRREDEVRARKAAGALLDALPELWAVYFFGSRARGDARMDSDWDFALLAAKELAAKRLMQAVEVLVDALGDGNVDLVDLRKAGAPLRVQVIVEGKRLACRDRWACEMFESFVFSDYARLNEERAGILEDVFTRGCVRG